MSQISFITSCVEFYAEHTERASTEIYSQFARSGLLDMLRSDYEDLHGLSFEYLMGLFDEFLQPQDKALQ
ncbi:MAG: DUF3791 domain-containing protein [Planctomycetaceae bacterium]|jgi:hypothetical protein|nr:DUF3791 domain-containing protein [Planctomycetaceae bacterium]